MTSFPEDIRKKAETAMAEAIANSVSGLRFFDMYRIANVAAGFPQYDQHSPCYRLADRFLQKHRAAGNIEKFRFGGLWMWKPTASGSASLRSPDTAQGTPA